LADISGLGYYSDVPVEEGEEHKPRGFLLYDDGETAPPTVLGQLETLAGLKFITIGTIAEMNDRGLPFKDVAAFIARIGNTCRRKLVTYNWTWPGPQGGDAHRLFGRRLYTRRI
jgi:hypothetical protein